MKASPKRELPRAIVGLLLGLTVAAPANAQSLTEPVNAPGVFAAERFLPATDREGVFDAESGSVHQHLDYDVALWGMYALNPLNAWRRGADGSLQRVGPVVAHRIGTNLVAQLSLFDWVALGIDIPVALMQLQGTGVPASLNPGSPALIGIGDIRLAPKIRLLRAQDAGIDVAVLPSFTLHTGFPVDGNVGEGFYTFQPRIAFSREWKRFRFAGDVGLLLRADKTLLEKIVGPQFTYRAGVGYKFHPMDVPIGIDLGLSGNVQITPNSGAPAQQPLEALLGAYWDVWGPVQVFGGLGARLLVGPPTPDLRVFAGARWAPRAPRDGDGDGVSDDVDACLEQAEDKDGFEDSDGCPDPDNDGDGVDDAADKCADEAEDKDGFEDTDGCPDPDNDGDGVEDAADKCAEEAEDKDGFEDEDGCPDPDNDGDGVADAADKCPNEAEDKDGFEDADGCPDPDNDGDGVADAADKCPNEAEDKDGVEDDDGCPDADPVVTPTDTDTDGDGVANAADKCADEAEDKDGFEDEDGCPDPDNDGDGVADAADKCADEAEDKDGFEDEDGCPDPDNDGDGVADADDKCPTEAEVINGVDDGDGCPDEGKQQVVVGAERIEIVKKVYFDTGKATIQQRSYSLLKQVAAVMRANPQLLKVSVDGHTDSTGNAARNKQLSELRAQSVMRFLVAQRIKETRLQAVGYGSDKPLEENETWAGRTKNRRVEFTILERAPATTKPATTEPAKTE